MFKLTNFNSPAKRSDNLFDVFFDDLFDIPVERKNSVLKVDIKEQDGNYLIEADLPGIKKEDVKINYENDHLLIAVERKEEKEEEGKNYIHRERNYSSMQRAIYLPNIDSEKVKAKLENGVLKLSVEKKPTLPKGKLIEIE